MLKSDRIRLGIIVALVAGITVLHYVTAIDKHHVHDIYRRLYYLPIVLGGLWFTLKGGLSTALAISIIYAPHVVFQWGHHPGTEPEQYLEILLYNVIGLVTGFLTQRERQQRTRYQQVAEHLEESYAKLRAQADEILEVEEQLRRADRLSALGEMAAEMAHEIRNPLGAIRGTAEILQDGIPPGDKRREFADILLREVSRLNTVVENILRYASPSGETSTSCAIDRVLGEVLSLVARQAQRQGVRLDLSAVAPLRATADGEQLRQAFLNLMLNAVQAMSAGGELRVSCVEEHGWVLVRFADNGPGIAPENLARIFTPFFTTRSDGVGLGLAITQRIVQRVGGELSVVSTLGEGTTFTVKLPPALKTGDA